MRKNSQSNGESGRDKSPDLRGLDAAGPGAAIFVRKSGFTGGFGSGCAEMRQNPVLFTLQTDVFWF